MSTSPEVSVIVPVYNVKLFLKRCIQSLINQTFDNYEIILVDDGSTDGSEKLCDQLDKKYSIVRSIHKENGGLGSARNYGLNIARGEYICFVDSDDAVKGNYIEMLYNALIKNKADLSVCGYEYSSKRFSSVVNGSNRILSGKEVITEFVYGNSILNFAWNKLYRKEIINRMDMWFGERHCAEDMYFNSYYYRLIDRVVFVDDDLYVYFTNFESLSNCRRSDFWEDMVLVYENMIITCKLQEVEMVYIDNLLFIMLRNALSNFLNKRDTSYKEFSIYLAKCLMFKPIKEYKINQDSMSEIDKILFILIKKNMFRLVYIIIFISKIVKRKMFLIFSVIRKRANRR